jgi:glycosyltransferase involved in cell wall biosynthesis
MRPVFFDASRLFIRGSRFSPTGIDRVVTAYARWLLDRTDIDLHPVVTFGGQVWKAPRALLAEIVEGAELFQATARSEARINSAWVTLTDILNRPPTDGTPTLRSKSAAGQIPIRALWHTDLLRRSLWRLRPSASVAGALYVNVSHTGLGNPRVLPRLAAKGASCVVMVHDLIPIEFPEYCAPGARARHVRRMDSIIGNTDLVIANSQTTADAVADYAHKIGRPVPRTEVALLGVESNFGSPPPPLRTAWPYFICVGTLEARKNLTFLLAVWRRLAERLGDAAPRLVLVGRRGWENESVIDQLDRSEAAAKLVLEVCDLQDTELARLIGGARALLSPSFTEGYDLPVIEALSLGTPVIASDIPAHRELASSAQLIDPLDGPGWLDAIAEMKTGTRPAFHAPRWSEHFAIVENALFGKKV